MYPEDEEEFLGFRGLDLRVIGTGKTKDESDFTFEVPIDLVQMEIEWVQEDTEKIVEFNAKAQKPNFKEV